MSSHSVEFNELRELQKKRDTKEREVLELRQLQRLQKEFAKLEREDFEKRIKEFSELEALQLHRRQADALDLAKTQLQRQLQEVTFLEDFQLARRLRIKKAVELKHFWKSSAEQEELCEAQKVNNEQELEEHVYEQVAPSPPQSENSVFTPETLIADNTEGTYVSRPDTPLRLPHNPRPVFFGIFKRKSSESK